MSVAAGHPPCLSDDLSVEFGPAVVTRKTPVEFAFETPISYRPICVYKNRSCFAELQHCEKHINWQSFFPGWSP